MSHFLRLFTDLKGAENQVEFAGRIGIDQPEVSKLLRRARLRPTRRTIVALLRTFPDRRDDIFAALLADDAIMSRDSAEALSA